MNKYTDEVSIVQHFLAFYLERCGTARRADYTCYLMKFNAKLTPNSSKDYLEVGGDGGELGATCLSP